MQQYLIDTNWILRYLLNDIPVQAQIVEDYFQKAKLGEITITVPMLVFVELDYALSKLYKFRKTNIIEKIGYILEQTYLEIENKLLIQEALKLYSRKNISFVDAIFCSQARLEGKKLLTFDKRLKN